MEALRIDEPLPPCAMAEPRGTRVSGRSPLHMEHRFGQRFHCGTPVRVVCGDALAGGGTLVNVSLSGAFIETALDLPLFTLIEVRKATGPGPGVALRAAVVRKDADGVGVEWCETPGRSICQIFGCTKHCEVA